MHLRFKILVFCFLLALPLLGQESSFEDLRKEYTQQFRIDLDSARSIALEMLKLSKSKADQNQEATAYKLIGNSYAVQANFEKANEYFYKSRDLLIELKDEQSLTTIYNNIGTVFYELGNYPPAQEFLLKSLRLAEKFKDHKSAARTYNNLGNIHSDLSNTDKALEYYKKSLELKIELNQKNRLPAAYNNIGLIYSKMNQHKLAIEYLNKSADIAKEIEDPRSESRAYTNIGAEFTRQEEFNKALQFLNQSIQIKKGINDQDGLASAYLYRGENYLKTRQYNKAISDCSLSLQKAETSGAANLQKEASKCISLSLEKQGKHQQALTYYKRFNLMSDSLFNKNKAQEITRNEMNYQFEKQQLADSIAFHKLQTSQQVAYERELNSQHKKFYITLIVSLLIIAFMGILYWRYKQNLKLKGLENQLLNSEIEFKKKDLTNLAINISDNQDWAESLAEKLEQMKSSTGRKRAKELEEIETEVKNKIWVNKQNDEFYNKIDELSSSFYHRLNAQFEGLTKTEIRMCTLIKLDLNTKQIATLQNINPASVKLSRNRLRKKLNLSADDDLNAFLRAF